MKRNELPPGWDERRIRELIDYYESQSDEEAAAEHEAALADSTETDLSRSWHRHGDLT